MVKEILPHFWRTFNGGICGVSQSNRGVCNIWSSRTNLVFQLPKHMLYQTEPRPDNLNIIYESFRKSKREYFFPTSQKIYLLRRKLCYNQVYSSEREECTMPGPGRGPGGFGGRGGRPGGMGGPGGRRGPGGPGGHRPPPPPRRPMRPMHMGGYHGGMGPRHPVGPGCCGCAAPVMALAVMAAGLIVMVLL